MEANVAVPVRITETGVVMNAPGYIFGALVAPDGTNPPTLTLHDNASAASGTKLTPATTFLADGGAQMIFFPAVWCKAGIYATVAGDGTVEIIVYCKKK